MIRIQLKLFAIFTISAILVISVIGLIAAAGNLCLCLLYHFIKILEIAHGMQCLDTC